MLRVGLTGGLGSGKSTMARLLAAHGAVVLSSDNMARAMMEPGEPLYGSIAEHFGPSVLLEDGRLDRARLAALAFDPVHPRVTELNALIHPPVLAAQERMISRLRETNPKAIVVIESALIFSAQASARPTREATQSREAEPWRARFDRIVVVDASEAIRLDRAVQRAAKGAMADPATRDRLLADAQARLAQQARTPVPTDPGLLHISNEGTYEALAERVDSLWQQLLGEARRQERRE